MATHPDEFGGIQQRLLESALDATEEQFREAERIVAQQFSAADGDARATLVVAIAQAIATNYLAAATVRNLPKG
jgi:hypothetical protein